ncbi:MAG TPA: hypothetical protein DD637_02630, partial [Verrucomicrobia bacterium]|nr:hypothetical protein [Verrucomicrobiota bacterium]
FLMGTRIFSHGHENVRIAAKITRKNFRRGGLTTLAFHDFFVTARRKYAILFTMKSETSRRESPHGAL